MYMKILSWNVNGIRASVKKGFLDWLAQSQGDIIALQETKAQLEQLDLETVSPAGYTSYWHSAQKKGYSGTAFYTKHAPRHVSHGMEGFFEDFEGRVLTLHFDNFVLINAYFPNSQRDHARLDFKLAFCKAMLAYTQSFVSKHQDVILCGDFNIAHREIDLKSPKTNQKTAGFLPQERAWMDVFLGAGYVDAFRVFESGPDHYTWWSYRPGVRARNIGWRIDYFAVNQGLQEKLTSCRHHPNVLGSDHCPVELDVNI